MARGSCFAPLRPADLLRKPNGNLEFQLFLTFQIPCDVILNQCDFESQATLSLLTTNQTGVNKMIRIYGVAMGNNTTMNANF